METGLNLRSEEEEEFEYKCIPYFLNIKYLVFYNISDHELTLIYLSRHQEPRLQCTNIHKSIHVGSFFRVYF